MFRYTPELAAHYLQRSFSLGDRVIASPCEQNVWYVTSSTTPGEFWRVDRYGCLCPGYGYRGHCRHFVRISWTYQNERRAQQGRPLLSPPEGWQHNGERIAA